MESLSAREAGQGDLPDGGEWAICLCAAASLTFFFHPRAQHHLWEPKGKLCGGVLVPFVVQSLPKFSTELNFSWG